MIEFFPLSEKNLHQVAQIDKESLGEESWSEKLYLQEIGDPTKFYYVATNDDIVVGFGGFAQILDEGHIMNIAVSPQYRRQGIGRKIIEKMIQKGKEIGINAFTLEVRESNDAARKLYEKEGFTLAGIRKKYYGGLESACIYWLYL